MSIADNLGSVTRRIQKATVAAGPVTGGVQLLAVSKTRTAEDIREAAAAGQLAFGENYVQEAMEKIRTLTDLPDLEWHFIGPIQSNKTRDIAEHFHWVHSVDRAKIAQRLSDQRPAHLPPLNMCIQVNIDAEPSKSGVAAAELGALTQAVSDLPGIRLRGLMAIPDPDQSEDELRESFKRLASLLQQCRAETRERPGTTAELDTLSMGMSNDLELAISAGATIVRVGTAIFGARAK